MFRYIALAWNDTRPTESGSARRLGLELQAHPEWNSALVVPGLQVFTTGARTGVNGGYDLPDGQGVVLGRLFRRRDLETPSASDVQLRNAEANRIARTGGQTLVDDYWGRYVAFLRTPSGATCVVRDPSGTLPCFLLSHEGVTIVFSWLEDVIALLPHLARLGVNPDGLAAHLLLGSLGGRETVLEGLKQIVPGEAVVLGDGIEKAGLLWNAVGIAQDSLPYEPTRAEESLRATVRACVRAWAACHDKILLRLSGGVDSAILLSCLAQEGTRTDLVCLNYHSPGADGDERRYARMAATRARRELIERERDPDFNLDRILSTARTPSPINPVGWLNARVDAELASAHSATALFTGAGGDQLFFEFARWWPAADYLRAHGPGRGFVSAAIDAARLGKVSVWRAAGLALADCLRPSLLPREALRYKGLLGPAARVDAVAHERFMHPALVDVDLPIGKEVQTRALIHPVGYYDPFEQASAAELVNPLLSQPLVELCLRLPTYLLTQGGRGRALARRAFASDLPPEIASRRSKGGMEEHLRRVLLRNIDFARGMLIDGELVRRGLIDRARIEELLSGRPTTLGGHTGQIHALLGIEAWLSRWS
jgi:asparagine synthase (glutamine-hydrolysing)